MEIIVTPHLALVPYFNHNDGNRLQMSASQLRQTIALENREVPMVVTGFEKILLKNKAKKDGIIKYVDDFLIYIVYDDGEEDIIYLSMFDIPNVKAGDRVNSNNILFYPEGFVDNDNPEILAYGINLFCGVQSHSLAYEDAYVISTEANNKFNSYIIKSYDLIIDKSHFLDYNSHGLYFPQKGEIYKKNETVFKKINRKKLSNEDIAFDFDIEILNIKIIVNQKIDYDLPPEFRSELAKIWNEKYEEYAKLNQYKIGNAYKMVHGIGSELCFEIKDWIVFIRMVYKERHRQIYGDKITNRHAGKGVISLITDDMPFVYPEKKSLDIILNPMSIISRMNIGTFYEIISSRILYFFNKKLNNELDIEKIKEELLYFYNKIDLNPKKPILSEVNNLIKSINDVEIIRKIKWLFFAPPGYSVDYNILEELSFKYIDKQYIIKDFIADNEGNDIYLLELNDTDNVDEIIENLKDTFNISEEEIKYYLENKKESIKKLHPFIGLAKNENSYYYITVGWVYYLKLVHLASYKLTARSIGKLSQSMLQPVKIKNDTGQRIGEMETINLISYDVIPFLHSVLTKGSDEILGKSGKILNLLFNIDTKEIRSMPNIQYIITSYLKVLMDDKNFEL